MGVALRALGDPLVTFDYSAAQSAGQAEEKEGA
jgi:hypothetical protein